jgi:hypothetical protein
MKIAIFAGAVFLSLAVPAAAQHAAAPAEFRRYVTVLATTTVAYRPPGSAWDGFQNDVSPQLGVGYVMTPRLCLELDAGPTFIQGDYVSFSLVPGAILTLSPQWYSSLRFVIPVDPETNLAVSPGVGRIFSLSPRRTLYVEADLASFVGRGDPDLGVTVTTGFLYSF